MKTKEKFNVKALLNTGVLRYHKNPDYKAFRYWPEVMQLLLAVIAGSIVLYCLFMVEVTIP